MPIGVRDIFVVNLIIKVIFPLYVWTKEHIEAHFLTCFVALTIARILENKLERKYSIGTIFAFVLVCGGVLMLPPKEKIKGRFHLPYINGKFLFPLIFIGGLVFFYFYQPEFFHNLTNINDPNEGEFRLAIIIFIIANVVLCGLAIVKNLSLIPLIGLSSCLYLLTGMSHENWFWFGLWFAVGLVIYFLYGYKNSRLNQTINGNQ